MMEPWSYFGKAVHQTLRRAVDGIVVIRQEELANVLQAFCAFFLLLAAYFLLLPLRDEAGMSLGGNALPALFGGSLILTLAAAPVASSFFSNPSLPKGQALMILNRFFGCSLIGFFALYTVIPQPPPDAAKLGYEMGWACKTLRACFYLWISLLNLLVCSALWARLADIFTSEAASRLYGYIGAGATLGQLSGSLLAVGVAHHGPTVLLASAALMELAARSTLHLGEIPSAHYTPLFSAKEQSTSLELGVLSEASSGRLQAEDRILQVSPSLRRRSEGDQREEVNWREEGGAAAGDASSKGSNSSSSVQLASSPCPGPSRKRNSRSDWVAEAKPSIWEGLLLIAASPYLLHVCLFLLLTAINSSFFYFERTAVIGANAVDPVQRRVLFAQINSMSAVAILLGQVLLTGRIISTLGTTAALGAGPAVSLLAMLAISIWPVTGAVIVAEASRKLLNYVITRPGREVLFTVVSREEKYKAKVCIDTVVQRLGDATAAGLFRVLGGAFGLGPSGVALGAMPFCVLWLLVGLSLGRRHKRLAEIALATPLPFGA